MRYRKWQIAILMFALVLIVQRLRPAVNKVANTISSELPKSVAEASNRVAKEAAGIRAEIKSIVAQMNKGLQFAGAVTGIGLVANKVKDVAVAAAQTADELTSIRSRINLINDGSQTTAEIMDKIYGAANRSRGSYIDMADSVAKLNMLAKDAFSSNDEAIAFVEQLNKQFKISGASKSLALQCISLPKQWRQVSYKAMSSVLSWKMRRY